MIIKGHFTLNKQLTPTLHEFLNKFNQSRRLARVCDNTKYGFQGEFYVDDAPTPFCIGPSSAPESQLDMFCCWKPTEDGLGIEWDRNENFDNPIRWLIYLVNKILIPNGYVLSGTATIDSSVQPRISINVVDNVVTYTSQFGNEYEAPIGLDLRLDYVYKDREFPKSKKHALRTKAHDKVNAFETVLQRYFSTELLKTILQEVEEELKK